MTEALTTQAAAQLVPASYAEKAMASLMQLHSELMDEKERRVDLFRRLMEREQALAELKMYVKMLEEKVAAAPVVAKPVETAQPEPGRGPVHPERPTVHPERSRGTAHAERPTAHPERPTVHPERSRGTHIPPVPPQIAARPRPDGWKTW